MDLKRWTRFLTVAFLGSLLVPVAASFVGESDEGMPPALLLRCVLYTIGAAVATWVFGRLLRKLEPTLGVWGQEQAEFLDALPERWIDLGIAGAAAISLLLELAIIRWQGSFLPFFAFYKNFGLLSCFAGLGLGYALARRERIPLVLVLPLLSWQIVLMMGVRFGLNARQLKTLWDPPFSDQLAMGHDAPSMPEACVLYFFLVSVFLLTALAFIPIGQVCGRLMERRSTLRAYGGNLLGSLAGVLLMFVLSALWTPPVIWIALCLAGLLLLYPRIPARLLAGAGWCLAVLVLLVWPVDVRWNRIYSPYQALEVSFSDKGLMVIRAACSYYQRVHDLVSRKPEVETDPVIQKIRSYYDLPYQARPRPQEVAVVGAGSGNDVAAALRAGAQHVDAIEIDPVILMLGRENHPEHPYRDPRVNAVVNDARSYLRNTDKSYDLIVYGLLDSHTLASHASSVRLDSFVYTVDGLREARARLKSDGVLALSFSIMTEDLFRKIYLMLDQAFGHPPVCISSSYDFAVTFLITPTGKPTVPKEYLAQAEFLDVTSTFAKPGPRPVDVSTDDWPFFYMPQRVYPMSYLPMMALVLGLSFWMTMSFSAERPQTRDIPFFFLGAGFMLVETKGITEMGLTFGNTWQVIGLVIAGILIMAFLANAAVRRFGFHRPHFFYLLLLASLGIGWWVSRSGGLPSTAMGRLGTIALLTSPMFFSGIVFSTLLASRRQIAGIMALNLLGAMVGGMLEYNSMYFGFRFLYLLAMGCYLLAFLFGLTPKTKTSDTEPQSAQIAV